MSTRVVKRKPKYQSLADDLKRDIQSGKLGPGDFLPPQNTLVAQYGFALATVRQALSRLQMEGYVRAEKGRGVVVEDPAHWTALRHGRAVRDIGFALWERNSAVAAYLVMLCGVQERLRAVDRRVVFERFDPAARNQEAFRRFAAEHEDLIVTGWVKAQELVPLVPPGRRMVVLGHPVTPASLSEFGYVSADAESAGYLATQVLTGHGHRRLALVSRDGSRYFSEVRAGVERASREAGCELEVRNYQTHAEARELGAGLGRAGRVTAIAVEGDETAGEVIGGLRDAGVRVPRDISLIAVGGLPREGLAVPDLTRVNIRYAELGRKAAELVLDEPYVPRHVQLSPRLEGGRTVAAYRGGGGEISGQDGSHNL